MVKEVTLVLAPELAEDQELLKQIAARQVQVAIANIHHVEILKRSVDARKKPVKIHVLTRLYIQEVFTPFKPVIPDWPYVEHKESVLIVGAGPAGLFAALQCISLGKKPIILVVKMFNHGAAT